jgi:hypothetical protein
MLYRTKRYSYSINLQDIVSSNGLLTDVTVGSCVALPTLTEGMTPAAYTCTVDTRATLTRHTCNTFRTIL